MPFVDQTVTKKTAPKACSDPCLATLNSRNILNREFSKLLVMLRESLRWFDAVVPRVSFGRLLHIPAIVE